MRLESSHNVNIDVTTETNTTAILGVCKFKLPTQNLNLSDGIQLFRRTKYELPQVSNKPGNVKP